MRFHTTVDRASFLGCVVRYRSGFTVADRVDTVAANTVIINQYLAHRVGAPLGQVEVIGIGAHGVSMAFDRGPGIRVLAHAVREVLNIGVTVGPYDVLIEVELDVQLDTYYIWYWFFLRHRLRHRLRCGRYLTLGSAEVQTNTDTGHPLAVATVDVMHAIDTSAGEEHLSEIIFHPCAHIGKRAAVAATAVSLADALVRHSGGQVRAQPYTWLTEVIDGIESRQATFDVFVPAIGGDGIV